jgi:hypothetical protein
LTTPGARVLIDGGQGLLSAGMALFDAQGECPGCCKDYDCTCGSATVSTDIADTVTVWVTAPACGDGSIVAEVLFGQDIYCGGVATRPAATCDCTLTLYRSMLVTLQVWGTQGVRSPGIGQAQVLNELTVSLPTGDGITALCVMHAVDASDSVVLAPGTYTVRFFGAGGDGEEEHSIYFGVELIPEEDL